VHAARRFLKDVGDLVAEEILRPPPSTVYMSPGPDMAFTVASRSPSTTHFSPFDRPI
jgi:hypothetical protein